MDFLEKDLEEIIFNSFKADRGLSLRKRGLDIDGRMLRQFKIGNYGVCDLITLDVEYEPYYNPELINSDDNVLYSEVLKKKTIITIYELKKDKIGISALLQASRYAKGIKRCMNQLYSRCDVDDFKVKIVLIGRTIDTSGSFCYLPDIFDDLKVYTYSYSLNGLIFKLQKGYRQENEGFKIENK